jgi:hypothetical protein
MSTKTANTNTSDLLKLLATSMLVGGGANAAFRAFTPNKKVFDPERDTSSPEAGALPVYVDMTPEEAQRYEELTGLKATHTKSAADTDYNWLSKALVGGGGAVIGWSVIDKILDNMRKRQLNTKLEEAQSELANLYAAKPIKHIGELPSSKKIASLHEFMDCSYEVWKTAMAGNTQSMLKEAGVLDSIGEAVATPIVAPAKSLAGYSIKSVAPILAAIALLAGYSAYNKQAPVAGKRPELSAIRRESIGDTPRPYVELQPRIREPKPLDPGVK